MHSEDSPHILAIRCRLDGTLLEIVRDDFGIAAGIDLEGPFVNLLDYASRSKGRMLLDALARDRAVSEWELNAVIGDSVRTLLFAGVALEDSLFIIAGERAESLTHYYEELMRINNEQANAIRLVLKEQSQERRAAERDAQIYDELMKLNNELVGLQRELTKQNFELAQLNDQKNHFLGMAAHDLRNPLGTILICSQFLRQKGEAVLAASELDLIDTIHRTSDFMLQLVDDFLNVSKIESGKLTLDMQQTDVAALIEQSVRINRPLAGQKRITIEMQIESNLPRMNVDRGKISQVLNNLLTNAVKYSHVETEVTVDTRRVEGGILISVQDQGQGIPEQDMAKLFQPFGKTSVQATAGEKSTGLGLLIVKKIVEGHGGRIDVTSTVGRGSRFSVFLPEQSLEGESLMPVEIPAPRR